MIIDIAKRQAVSQIVKNLHRFSDKNLIRLAYLAEKIANDKDKATVRFIRKCWEEKHPAAILAKNILKNLSDKCREKLAVNFFINSILIGNTKRYEFEKEDGFIPPHSMVISPTMRCNLRCIGCYAGKYQKEELDFETVDRVIQEGKEIGMYFVTISGGEPFTWPHLFRIIEKHNDIYFQIYTNGTLIDKKIAEKLSQLGNVATAISVEGFGKETDKRRGKGTYQKVLKAMDNLREAHCLFGFSATPTKYNSEVLGSDEFVDFYIKKGCSIGWYFQYIPIGKNPDVSLMSTPEQRNKLRKRLNSIRSIKPIFIGDFWNDGPYIGGCIAGARPGGYLHINCNGDVEPCVFVHFAVDNIKNKSLKDAINSGFFKAIRDAQPYGSDNLLMPCMVIDHPNVLRSLVKKYSAKPTHLGSDSIINDKKISGFLDNYAKEFMELTNEDWEKEYKHSFKHWKERLIFKLH